MKKEKMEGGNRTSSEPGFENNQSHIQPRFKNKSSSLHPPSLTALFTKIQQHLFSIKPFSPPPPSATKVDAPLIIYVDRKRKKRRLKRGVKEKGSRERIGENFPVFE